MAVTLALVRAASGAPPTLPAQPPLVLIGDRGSRIVLPYAPLPVGYKRGMGWETVVMAGRGRPSLLLQGNPVLRTLSFDLVLARPDHQQSIEDWLGQLNAAADGTERWTVSYGPQEQGLWRITDYGVQVTARQHLTNAATRATATLTLTDAGSPTSLVPSPWQPPLPPPPAAPPALPPWGPLPPDVQAFFALMRSNPTAAAYFSAMHVLQSQIPPDPNRPATYTVRAGDTLSGISVRFYGGSRFFPLIALVNSVRNPNLIYPGQVFKLPAPVAL